MRSASTTRASRAGPVLHLIRDRVGIKPLYFTKTTRGEWLFASEIRALVAHPDVSRGNGSNRVLALPHVHRDAGAADAVSRASSRFPPATSSRSITRGEATATQYWDCRPDASTTLTERDLSEDDAVAELTRLLKQSIARRMVSDVPFGVLLSGGVDSSLNVALMSELMSRPVTTFTIGYEGKEDYNEFQFARQVSKRYRTDHHETLITQKEAQDFLPLLVRLQDEPIADNVCIPLYFLSRTGQAEPARRSCRWARAPTKTSSATGGASTTARNTRTVYQPARRSPVVVAALSRQGQGRPRPASAAKISRSSERAEAGQELFWGGAVCWWGEMRSRLTPNAAPFAAIGRLSG